MRLAASRADDSFLIIPQARVSEILKDNRRSSSWSSALLANRIFSYQIVSFSLIFEFTL